MHYTKADWQQEVRDGDTVRGFEDWLAAKAEECNCDGGGSAGCPQHDEAAFGAVPLRGMIDKLDNAKAQGQAQFDSIREMVEALRKAEADRGESTYRGMDDEARDRIIEDALSVEVRSGWHSVGQGTARPTLTVPAEYCILLCTGGTACQIVGELSEDGEPETARLQVQDWFTPWTDFRPVVDPPMAGERDPGNVGDAESILLEYARQFYFGE